MRYSTLFKVPLADTWAGGIGLSLGLFVLAGLEGLAEMNLRV